MLPSLDKQLNKVTTYRLVLYVLLFWLLAASAFGFFGKLSFSGWQIIGTCIYLLIACWLINRVFAWVFRAPAHDDSAYITAMILALIITPFRRESDAPILIWAPIIAMGAKYIIALHRQHVFNPAALAMVITGFAIQKSASWWVGTEVLFWPVLIGGFLVVKKIRRFDAVTSYLVVAMSSALIYALVSGSEVTATLRQLVLFSPLIFFSTIMLVEPETMPPRHVWRLVYGGLVGLLSAPFIHIGSFYFTPELALVTGNLCGWLLSRRERFVLTLREQVSVGVSISELVFDGPRRPSFQAGQYLEWNLSHQHPDSRGIRRYFTIASSPTESGLRLGIKKYQPMSSYKQALLKLQPGQTIIAEQLDGDFTLPKNQQQPLVFIAGGIGITPFRSMLKYLLDQHETRPMTLFYANQVKDDIVYTDIIKQAEAELGLKTVYVLSDKSKIPADWTGQRGYITAEMLKQEVPNYGTAIFYLSGPQGMVTAYEKILRSLRVKRSKIVTDYFPGFA